MKTFPLPFPATALRAFASGFAALTLACAAQAQDGPPGGDRGRPPSPPPEAVQACEGQAEGASVSFTLKDGKALTGTCRKLDGQLVAMPARMDRKPPANNN
jgi:hypothetical protein